MICSSFLATVVGSGEVKKFLSKKGKFFVNNEHSFLLINLIISPHIEIINPDFLISLLCYKKVYDSGIYVPGSVKHRGKTE